MRLIVFDLDGCLYAARHLYSIFDAATARAGIHLGLKMSFEEALRINLDAQARGELFPLAYIHEHGIPLPDLHRRYHDTLSETIVDPVEGLAQAFSRLEARYAILSHGNRDWIERVLVRLGIRDFFPPESLFALEDNAYVLKTQDERPFLAVQDRFGVESPDITMAEDTHRNLIIPHGMGWRTALIHHGTPRPSLPDHVHAQHPDPIGFLESLIMAPRITKDPKDPVEDCAFFPGP